jgi:transposase
VVGESHGSVLALVGIVFPAKRHVVVVDRNQAVVGNGDSMSVAGQVPQNVFRTAEGRLGVNDPLLPGDGFEKCCEVIFVGERHAVPKESQLMVAKRLAQTVRELAPKNTAEHFHRQKEARS